MRAGGAEERGVKVNGWTFRGRGQNGWKLACGETVEGLETIGQLGSGQTAIAIEGAEESRGRGFSFARVAVDTGRDEVAIGIAPTGGARDDVVEATDADGQAAEAVETE